MNYQTAFSANCDTTRQDLIQQIDHMINLKTQSRKKLKEIKDKYLNTLKTLKEKVKLAKNEFLIQMKEFSKVCASMSIYLLFF